MHGQGGEDSAESHVQCTACNHINILHLSISLPVPVSLNKEGLLVPLKGTTLNCNLVLGFSLAFL